MIKKILTAIVCGWFVAAAFVHAQVPTELTADLDALLQANASARLLQTLQKVPDSDDLVRWLRMRAEEGHVIAQSELAWRLASHNKREALAWHFVALINQTLDANECKGYGNAQPVMRSMRRFPLGVSEAETVLYADAIDDAIKIALRHGIGERGKQPPWWICAPGVATPSTDQLHPESARIERRQLMWERRFARERDLSTEIRLNANLNSDRYRIWKLDAKFWEGRLISHGDDRTDSYFSVVWVDNDTLLFGGYEVLMRPGSNTKFDPIYQWDLRANQIKQYAESGFGLCYFKGFISYYIQRDGTLLYREGEIGQEREIALSVREARDIDPGRAKTNERFRCRRYSSSESPHAPPIWALESGGRIKREGRFETKDRSAVYFPPDSTKPVNFDPFEGLRPRVGNQYWTIYPPRYSEYLDASWFNVVRSGPVIDPLPIWIISTASVVQPYKIPPGPWAGSKYGPAKNGWFALTANGLYFLSENKQTKILSGRAQAIRVSPNGCRAAVGTPIPNGKGEPMWVIDICQKGDDQ